MSGLHSLPAHPAVAAALGAEASVASMLRVEAALARVLGRHGLIPAAAAEAIARAAAEAAIDRERLREGAERTGFPVIELVRQLRAQAGEPARDYVHWGATTQDVLDTALVLQLRQALGPIEQDLAKLIESLAGLAERHRGQVMAGRTHTQQAVPITFGYKVATWLAPLLRHRTRLSELKPRLLVVQFGGAAGTLAAYGEHGPALYAALARELDLGVAAAPWHAQRDSLVEFAGWLALVAGSLGKLAQDVLLLAQTEVGEIREADDAARGGSSAMPQKSNPVASEQTLTAARACSALLATMHQALFAEHERGTHALQLERLALPQMVSFTAAALARALFVSDHLAVDATRMRENLEASQGTILAEAVRNALAAAIGRDEAEALVKEAWQGPEPDLTRMLSGHPEGLVLPPPVVPAGSPWTSFGNDTNTAYAGPWGISYATNLTPDEATGIGIWTAEIFVETLRSGRHWGQSRPILPPMPWQAYRNLTDEDLHAMYAYLRTVPPIHNRVPETVAAASPQAAGPPVSSG